VRTLVIGRSPFADVVVADPSVATHHAEIVITDDGTVLPLPESAGGSDGQKGKYESAPCHGSPSSDIMRFINWP